MSSVGCFFASFSTLEPATDVAPALADTAREAKLPAYNLRLVGRSQPVISGDQIPTETVFKNGFSDRTRSIGDRI